MENLQHGYNNEYANEISKIRDFYFGNRDNMPASRYQETLEASNERKQFHANKIKSDAIDKVKELTAKVLSDETKHKSRLRSKLFPNSTSTDPIYKSLGESQLTRAQQIMFSSLDKQRVLSAIEQNIDLRNTDTIGAVHNYYSNFTPKNQIELQIKSEVLEKTNKYFAPYNLEEQQTALQKIDAVKPRLADLRRLFGLPNDNIS
jgi:hypothetical protein